MECKMPNFNYFLNIPAAANNPSVDQPNMETNTNSINSIIGIDHFSFGSPNGSDGTHQQVNLRVSPGVNGALPAGTAGPGWNTLFTSNVTATSTNEIFLSRGGTAAIELTGPGAPLAATNGRSFFAGGIRFEWGIVTLTAGVPHDTANVFFVPAFTTTCFNIQATLIANGSGQLDQVAILSVFPIDNTVFKYVFNGVNSSHYPMFYWTAIGD